MEVECQPPLKQNNCNSNRNNRPHQRPNIAHGVKDAKHGPNQDTRQKHQHNRRHPQSPREPLRAHAQYTHKRERHDRRKCVRCCLNCHLSLLRGFLLPQLVVYVLGSQNDRSCQRYSPPQSAPRQFRPPHRPHPCAIAWAAHRCFP